MGRRGKGEPSAQPPSSRPPLPAFHVGDGQWGVGQARAPFCPARLPLGRFFIFILIGPCLLAREFTCIATSASRLTWSRHVPRPRPSPAAPFFRPSCCAVLRVRALEVAAELLETAQSEAVKVRLIEVLVGEGKAPPSRGARGRTVRAGRGGVRVPGPADLKRGAPGRAGPDQPHAWRRGSCGRGDGAVTPAGLAVVSEGQGTARTPRPRLAPGTGPAARVAMILSV